MTPRARGAHALIKHARGGFTLMEIMFAAGILAMALAVAVPTASVVLAAREKTIATTLAGQIRYLFHKARLERLWIRVVFDLDKNEYLIESSDQPVFMRATKLDIEDGKIDEEEDKQKKEEAELRARSMSNDILGQSSNQLQWTGWGEYKSQLDRRQAQFDKVNDRLAEAVKLPEGVRFGGVFTIRQTRTATKGKAYLFIYPHGFVEPAVIYVEEDAGDRGGDPAVFSLITDPLTGAVRILDERVREPDFDAEARDAAERD